MPRGSRIEVTQYERRRWLEQLERGLGVTGIAKSAGRDIRVVKRHLVIAQQEAELSQARTGFLRSRMELHQEDLLNETIRIRGIVDQKLLITLQSTDPVEARLNLALLEHLDRNSLKPLLNQYGDLVDERQNFENFVTTLVESNEVKILRNLPSGIETHPWTAGVMQLLKERAGLSNPIERDYLFQVDANSLVGHVTFGRGWTLTIKPVGEHEGTQIMEAHKELVAVAISHLYTLRDIHGRRSALSEKMVFALDSLLLMRMVPGRCNLCLLSAQ